MNHHARRATGRVVELILERAESFVQASFLVADCELGRDSRIVCHSDSGLTWY